MRFYNHVLSRSLEITQKTASELKVLVSDKYNFPSIDKDSCGPILRIPKPIRKKKGFILNGITFQNDALGRAMMMRMVMSSVEHLSIHAMVSNFSSYKDWVKGKDQRLAVFVIDLIEDLCVNWYVKSGPRGLLQDFAFSNAVSYATLTKPETIRSKQILMQSALLSYFIAGRYRYLLPSSVKRDVFLILGELQKFEKFLSEKNSKSMPSKLWNDDDINKMKMRLADSIYKRLKRYGAPKQMLYLPYTESGTATERFSQEQVFDMTKSVGILADTYKTLGLKFTGSRSVQEILRMSQSEDTAGILYEIAHEQLWKDRLVKHYMKLVNNTEFDDFVFPEEDYAEYYRIYRKYAGAIRKVIDQIRQLKNDLDSNPNQEIGQTDLQEVIQAISGDKANYNMFIRDDYLTKNEAWGILLDMSSSLKPFSVTTKEMALCLGEVAKELMAGEGNWGLYAFSNKFTVVKDIGEEYNANVKARIGGLGKGGLSYIPDALQLGAQILTNAGKEHNYLFVISDGLPSGYPGIEAKLETTIKKLTQGGLVIIPVGIGSNALQKYLRNTYLKADNVHDLMGKFTKIYFSLSSN
ncbi:MAG: hypothetical protein ACRD3Z_03810 [Nitrososphaerales archaeon]